ncbi:MAG: hypothetical protein COV10_00480 [Candidatus Vogelbacteria bacterium CG10_big_fil_rev_8_21_14_0_10_51_16]|uniref:Uncharacterized protein n=1 Tax=Candidatus Vogelbacteria bacterium CG10_big_fil_rev_8_21_14_0_10_51_16 TaxID=1975045 RepID=A0A2H0RFG4_9BACT|nr:MAG: hypothetical protein COV10_00480 [Candidatus Vogelbacteria bacterium CG10_big_fil_rev_8_21_14_0_10_51_16]
MFFFGFFCGFEQCGSAALANQNRLILPFFVWSRIFSSPSLGKFLDPVSRPHLLARHRSDLHTYMQKQSSLLLLSYAVIIHFARTFFERKLDE